MAASSDSRIAIVGAAGQTGLATLAALAGHRGPVRALVRRAEQEEPVRAAGATEVAVIDLDDPSSLSAAFDGASVVFHIPPVFTINEPEQVESVLAAATAAAVERFVFHSVLQPFTPGVRHHERKARSEALVRTSGLTWRILQPGMYMQTVKLYYDRAADGTVIVPYSLDTIFTPIDRADVGAAAALLITADGHDFATYELCGAEVLSTREMLAILARALGVDFEVRVGSVGELALPPHWSDDARTDVAAMYEHYDKVGLFGGHRVAEMLLGRAPTSFFDAFAT